MAPKFKSPTEKTIRALLERYACPVPYHEVRTRFLGGTAAPILGLSPLRIVNELWGGELPPFDSIDELNELLNILINGLWNSLTKHDSRSSPFRLARLNLEPSPKNLGLFAQVRRQELEGFVEGLCNGQDQLDLPERAHQALEHLGELRAIMAGIEDLVARDIEAESRTELETTFKHVRELTKTTEVESHAAVMSCVRARRQIRTGIGAPKSALH
ncbi:MAG: hypothetical protein ACOYLK_12435 [Sphingomonas sp.]